MKNMKQTFVQADTKNGPLTTVSQNVPDMSLGTVATHLRFVYVFNDQFITNLLSCLTVEEIC